jgi:hypothetical protein
MLKHNYPFSVPLLLYYTMQTLSDYYVVGELDDLTTNIITGLEFFNFVSEISHLQYE